MPGPGWLAKATSTQAPVPLNTVQRLICAVQGRRGGTCHWASADRFGLSHQCMTPVLATPQLATGSDPASCWLNSSVVGPAALNSAATPPVVCKMNSTAKGKNTSAAAPRLARIQASIGLAVQARYTYARVVVFQLATRKRSPFVAGIVSAGHPASLFFI